MSDEYEGPERRRDYYEAGRREATVDAHIAAHERRLNAINGSIDHAARRTEELAAQLGELRESMQRLLAQEETRQVVSEALRKEVEKANATQLKSRTFVIGVLGVMAAVATLAVAVLNTVAHG